MKKGKVIRLLALGWLSFTFTGNHEPARDSFGTAPAPATILWQKALEVYNRNRDWYPQRVSILSEVLNRHGEPYSLTEMLFSLRLDDQGQIQAKLERALRNGKDTTEKIREKVEIHGPQEGMDPSKEQSYSVSISDSPFDPERQGAVVVTPSSEKSFLFGHSCRRFDFVYRTQILRNGKSVNLTWTGMAWLKEESGLPVKLEFSLAPLPSRIRNLWTIYLYDTARPDQWVVKKMCLAGQGGFLFIKKRFRTTTTFSNYRRPPPKDEPK